MSCDYDVSNFLPIPMKVNIRALNKGASFMFQTTSGAPRLYFLTKNVFTKTAKFYARKLIIILMNFVNVF